MASKDCNEKNGPVTQRECGIQHKSVSRQLWAVFTVFALFGVVCSLFGVAIGWSFDAADTAVEAADVAEKASVEVKRQFDVHDAKQEAVMDHIGKTLERIEKDGKETRQDMKEQRKLIEQIHRNGGH